MAVVDYLEIRCVYELLLGRGDALGQLLTSAESNGTEIAFLVLTFIFQQQMNARQAWSHQR